MGAKGRRSEPGIIFKNGMATAVILDIDYYRDMLESLEDVQDVIMLMKLPRKPLKFRRLGDFLAAIECGRTIN